MPQHAAQLPHPPSKIFQAQIFWHLTTFFESRKNLWHYYYRLARLASMPSYTRQTCPLCYPHYAAMGLYSRQPNTSSSIVTIFLLLGMPLETTRGIYQT
jgi:hypothetical protein